MAAPGLDTKSPKNTLTFCNRVTMETRVQLHQGRVDVSRKRESRWGEGGCTIRSAVPKNWGGGDELLHLDLQRCV